MNAAGNATTSAREEILGRIRAALPGTPVDPIASHGRIHRLYTRVGNLTRAQCLELFVDRLLDYDTEILQIESEEEIPGAAAAALSAAQESSLLAAEAFPQQWLPANCVIVRDTDLSTPQLESATTVITTCEAAVALTGTILLVHAGAQGRRVLTLLPDHHICLVRRDQVYETLSEALAAVAPHSKEPLTTISGPSATSDIEMTRIRGVHGPRRLTVILYGRSQVSEGAEA